MLKLSLLFNIDSPHAGGKGLRMAVTIVCPPDPVAPGGPVVFFAWPGGGYNRHYYDLQLPGRSGYSQAEYHAARGIYFVACDHPGVGESDIPDVAFSHADTARVNAALVRTVMEELRKGSLDDRIPPLTDIRAFGLGQSYGGLLLTVLQAADPIFDGVAMLGWSAICTEVNANSGDGAAPLPSQFAGNEVANQGLQHPYRRAFHYDDVPEDIVAEDMRGYPFREGVPVPKWAAVHMPGGPKFAPERGPLGPGVVVMEAASIQVPVFIGSGEVDTLPDPRSEPSAYSSSTDITLMILARSAHMHNFAGTRQQLWRRLHDWAASAAKQ